jgi:3-oxoacyl-[acyl-carrier protein] reductase
MRGLQDRVAILTGAARGIGWATGQRLLEEGTRVLAVDLDAAGLQSLRQLAPERCEPLVLDVTAPDAPDRALVRALERFDRLDFLINNAGGALDKLQGRPGAHGMFATVSAEDWDLVFTLNVRAPFLWSKAVAPHLVAQRSGAIVNLSSVAARRGGLLSDVAYVSAKAAIIGLTRRLADELTPQGVRCNAVAPGLTATEQIVTRVPPELQVVHGGLGRMAEPAEQAAVIAFLVSDDASYISGEIVDVNGGTYFS